MGCSQIFKSIERGTECKNTNVPAEAVLELQISPAQVTNANVQRDNHFKQNFLLIKSLP